MTDLPPAEGAGASAAAPAPLPNRRMNLTIGPFLYKGTWWIGKVGFSREGRAQEIFLDSFPVDGKLQAITEPLCIQVSHLLQRGLSIDAARRRLVGGMPSGLMTGLVVDALYEAERVETECGTGIREGYRAAEERQRREHAQRCHVAGEGRADGAD